MKLTSSFDISASALTAQRLRMDVISSNIANAETTRGKLVDGKWTPYQRKIVTFEPNGQKDSFAGILENQMGIQNAQSAQGVKVTKISDDPTPFKRVFNPMHPDADADGYVYLPNVDTLKEMTDMLLATHSYEANVTVLNASKAMLTKALEIGR